MHLNSLSNETSVIVPIHWDIWSIGELPCSGVIETDNWRMSEGCFNYCFTWLTHWLKTSSMMMCSIDHHRSSSTKWGNGGSLNPAMLHSDIFKTIYLQKSIVESIGHRQHQNSSYFSTGSKANHPTVPEKF